MDNYKIFDGISAEILKDCVIKTEKEKFVETLSIWLEMQLFKMVAVLYIMCKHNGQTKADKETLENVKKMFNLRCKHCTKKGGMIGGRLGSSTYMGIEESMYSAANEGQDILNVDLKDGLIRPEISNTEIIGGAKNSKYSKKIKQLLSLHCKYHDMKISKDVQTYLINMMLKEIQNIKNDLKKENNLTLKKMNSILKKHNVFH